MRVSISGFAQGFGIMEIQNAGSGFRVAKVKCCSTDLGTLRRKLWFQVLN